MSLSDSDSSSLSSLPLTEDESPMEIDDDEKPAGIAKYFKKKESESPPPPKRSPSPPHEYVLADNPNIAFIVMFRARFSDVFPRSLPHYGPQDIERGVVESPPGDYIERLLCALLGLVLNRKKDVERNHYQRPLEEAVSAHWTQWPKAWGSKNPLQGGRTFATMSAEERLQLLRALTLWSLSSSEAVQTKIKDSYKQTRHDDDLNQPLSVQPWGRDSRKRRYWLIEGQDDTHFRLYRESNPAGKTPTWWNVAGSIPELLAVADKLDEEKSQNARKLSERIRNAIPRFEASEEKRKRRDYRLARKAAFTRPEPGFSLYEGRTRGKKLKFTYSDDEDIFSDDMAPRTRRSTRNSAAVAEPAEPAGPKYTTSGRQIRSRAGGTYGETLLTTQRGEDAQDEANGRTGTRGTRAANRANGYANYDDSMEDEPEAQSSENEWQGGDEGDENDFEGDDEDEASGDESVVNGNGNGNGNQPRSLMVQLRYGKGKSSKSNNSDGPRGESSGDTLGVKKKAGADEVNNQTQAQTQAQKQAQVQVQIQQPPSDQKHESTTNQPPNHTADTKPSGSDGPSNIAVEIPITHPQTKPTTTGTPEDKANNPDLENSNRVELPPSEAPPLPNPSNANGTG